MARSSSTTRIFSATGHRGQTVPGRARRRGRRGLQGQPDREAGAPAPLALHVDAPAVRLGQAAYESQPQPHAAAAADGGRVAAIELLEDAPLLPGVDPDAVVLDLDGDLRVAA